MGVAIEVNPDETADCLLGVGAALLAVAIGWPPDVLDRVVLENRCR